MPQKPTMPSPYMTTVDATKSITLSCEINSKDTIVDYNFSWNEISNNNIENNVQNKKSNYPNVLDYIGSTSYSYMYSKRTYNVNVDIYKGENPNEYNALVPIDHYFASKCYSLKFEYDYEGTKVTEGDIKTIYLQCKVSNKTGRAIPHYFFKNCVNLSSVVFCEDEDGFTRLGAYAFAGCVNLKELVLPKSITTIQTYAFKNSNIKKLTLGSSFSLCCSADYKTCSHSFPKIFDHSHFEELVCDFKTGSNFTLYNGQSLKKVSFLYPLETITDNQFYNCTNLEIVNGINNVTKIGNNAFEGCKKFNYLFLENNSITSIGNSAFKDSGVENIFLNISENEVTIGEKAFYNCYNLKSITVISNNKTTEALLEMGESCFSADETFSDVVNVYMRNTSVDIDALEISLSLSERKFISGYIYSLEGYTNVPIYGGSSNPTLSRTISPNVLKNDCEYYWYVDLTDSYGNTIQSNNYYFKTRSSPNLKINQVLTEQNHKVPLAKETDYIDITETKGNYTDTSPIFVERIGDYPVQDDKETGDLFDETTERISAHIKSYSNNEIEIAQTVYDSVKLVKSYTGSNDPIEGFGFLELFHKPVNNKLIITVPTGENDEDGNPVYKDYNISLSFEAKINTSMYYKIIEIKDEDKSIFENLKESVETTETIDDEEITHYSHLYPVVYDIPFESGLYKITYYTEGLLPTYKHEFVANYEMENPNNIFVPVKSHKWALYKIVNGKETLIDETETLYSSYLHYTYNKFLTGDYRIEIQVENDEGVYVSNSYEFTVNSDNTPNLAKEPEFKIDTTKNAICIDFSDCEGNIKYVVIRNNHTDNYHSLISDNVYKGDKLYDLTVASGKEYSYTIYAYTNTSMKGICQSKVLYPEWDKITILGFNGSYADNSPIEVEKEDMWIFGLNIEDIEYKQNLSKTVMSSFGSQYAKIIKGNADYKTFDISCLIGNIQNEDYVYDDTSTIENWEHFVASAKAKMVIDTKGNIIVCDIINANNMYSNRVLGQPTTIKASFVEIAPSKNISLILKER